MARITGGAAAVVVALSTVLVGGGAGASPPAGSPAVTRAGLDPSLVAGPGATVDFVEQEAEPAATTPPPTITKPFRPNHFYDEQRLLLGRTYRAGEKIRLTARSGAAWTVIDLLDSQLVGPPRIEAVAANVLLFGADPTGRRDSADAVDRAIAFARRPPLTVYIPPGTYQVNRHIIVDNVTIQGAGSRDT